MSTTGRHGPIRIALRAAVILALLGTAMAVQATGGADAAVPEGEPYAVEPAVDTNAAPDVFETTLVARPATLDVGNGVTANMWTYNGTVPGPEIRLKVGDTVIVHYRNELPLPSAIHWHGIELNNASDGTGLTQDTVPPGGSFLYKFIVPRPGIFWYHPHHHPTNQVFRGLYGSFVVADPHDETLVAEGVLPGPDRTRTLVVSDTTVCKEPGHNDTDTYDDFLPWVGGGPLPEQPGPFPSDLCDRPMDDHGTPIQDANGRPIPLMAGDIPNIQRASAGRTNEGQTVLTNGRNAGGRKGSPEAPGQLGEGARTLDVAAGQGIRLQAINAATTRYVRLRLTDNAGNRIPLIRVGGEGGLLDRARIEGGIVEGPGGVIGFNTEYERGEILIAPSDRADIVLAIPRETPAGVATLWTLDFPRTGVASSLIPTVPVMHLDVVAPTGENFTVAEGAPLRTHSRVSDPVEALGPPRSVLPDLSGAIDPLLDPASFTPPKPGSANEDIQFRTDGKPTIDDVPGSHESGGGDYRATPHSASTRYARLGDLLELTVTNTTNANHVFHLHGFSFQPVMIERTIAGGVKSEFPFGYHEFVDSVDVQAGWTLRFRVRLDDRPQMDGITPGGGLGRWVLHCHLFFHASLGMHAELVVLAPEGNEKPFVNADAASVAVDQGGTASTTGTFLDPDGDPVALSASAGTVTDIGDGGWSWTNADASVGKRTVHITATDARGFRSQTAFDVDVRNVAPDVVLTAPPPGSAFAVGSTVTVAASITDPGPSLLSCRFDWDDGAGRGAPVAAAHGRCHDTRTLTRAGVHTVTVTGSDGEGGSDSDSTTIVVYDPNGGFVTGSGTTGSGGAAFDLAVRYLKSGSAPAGKVLYNHQANRFDFAATGFDWLVVNGSRAQARGSGSVGGVGGYDFLLTVVDSPDSLRLKVWERGSGRVVYDNAPDTSDDIDRAEPPPISLGSIVIHT